MRNALPFDSASSSHGMLAVVGLGEVDHGKDCLEDVSVKICRA